MNLLKKIKNLFNRGEKSKNNRNELAIEVYKNSDVKYRYRSYNDHISVDKIANIIQMFALYADYNVIYDINAKKIQVVFNVQKTKDIAIFQSKEGEKK